MWAKYVHTNAVWGGQQSDSNRYYAGLFLQLVMSAHGLHASNVWPDNMFIAERLFLIYSQVQITFL